MLIVRIAGKNDFVGINIVLRSGRNLFGFHDTDAQDAQDQQAGHAQAGFFHQLAGKKICSPESNGGVDQAKKQGRAHEPKMRDQ